MTETMVTGIPLIYAAVEEGRRALNGEDFDLTPLFKALEDPRSRDALLMYVVTLGDEPTMAQTFGEIEGENLVSEGENLVSNALDMVLTGTVPPNELVAYALSFLVDTVIHHPLTAGQNETVRGNLCGLIAALAFWAADEDIVITAGLNGVSLGNRLAYLVFSATANGIKPLWVSQSQ